MKLICYMSYMFYIFHRFYKEKDRKSTCTAQIIANFSPSCPELPVPNLQVQGHLIGLGLKVEFWTETFKELGKIGLNYVIYTMLKYIFVFTFKII